MKYTIVLVFILIRFYSYSQNTQPEVVEKNGKLVYVVPPVASQEIVLTVEILEAQQKAIKERKEFLEKQSKAIQDEYNALIKQESDIKDWMIAALKLKNNTPTASKQEEVKKQ